MTRSHTDTMEQVAARSYAAAPGTILVIEDDPDIAASVQTAMQARGYRVLWAADGAAGLACWQAERIDALIVDRMLPERDGISLVEQARAEGLNAPVLFLSALGSVDDRVRGLAAGGDDYLVKPFALAELTARIAALLRRPADARQTVLRVGTLVMDLIERTVHRDDVAIELLPREFKLLEYLARRPGEVVTRQMLLEDVWNYRFAPETNLVDVHIGKLRRKIDLPGEASLIESIRGTGFVFHVAG